MRDEAKQAVRELMGNPVPEGLISEVAGAMAAHLGESEKLRAAAANAIERVIEHLVRRVRAMEASEQALPEVQVASLARAVAWIEDMQAPHLKGKVLNFEAVNGEARPKTLKEVGEASQRAINRLLAFQAAEEPIPTDHALTETIFGFGEIRELVYKDRVSLDDAIRAFKYARRVLRAWAAARGVEIRT